MGTGIYKTNVLGELEEVPQVDIDYLCSLCQFPLATDGKCTSKEDIQTCWTKYGAQAGLWHILHECPFVQLRQKCRCDEFKTIEEAFFVTGLHYRKGEK